MYECTEVIAVAVHVCAAHVARMNHIFPFQMVVTVQCLGIPDQGLMQALLCRDSLHHVSCDLLIQVLLGFGLGVLL